MFNTASILRKNDKFVYHGYKKKIFFAFVSYQANI